MILFFFGFVAGILAALLAGAVALLVLSILAARVLQ